MHSIAIRSIRGIREISGTPSLYRGESVFSTQRRECPSVISRGECPFAICIGGHTLDTECRVSPATTRSTNRQLADGNQVMQQQATSNSAKQAGQQQQP